MFICEENREHLDEVNKCIIDGLMENWKAVTDIPLSLNADIGLYSNLPHEEDPVLSLNKKD